LLISIINQEDRQAIRKVLKTGKDARQIYRANALNLRNKGLSVAEVADYLELTPKTVYNIERNYEEGGLSRALNDDPRPGTPVKHDDAVKAHVVATVCSDPPEGFDRWTLDLIQDKLIGNELVDKISRESIRLILKEHDLKPWQQASWCVPRIDQEYIERMEALLDLYAKPHNDSRPMVCLDEKPIVLHDHVREPEGIRPGKCRRVDYEYKRNGTCNAFCIVEPKRGVYAVNITGQRKAEDFARQIKDIAESYPDAEKIDLVMDNLNTHFVKSLIKAFGEDVAKRLWNRFEIYYTPKHGSWLNQAEIAINMYARQCLGKTRIPKIDILSKKTAQWVRFVNERNVIIQWKFTTDKAREKFGYP
jgi:transposase